MGIVSYIVIFGSVWWILFYMLLPVGVKIKAKPEKGHADSAPENPNIGKKALITTALATLISWGLVFLIENGHLAFLIGNAKH